MSITRRDLLKSAACGAAALSIGGAVAAQAAEAPKAEPKMAFKPGTYVGSAMGKKGLVKVEATFSADAIESVEVIESLETADLSYLPLNLIPKMIVAAQSLAVDTVSGATFSSFAVKDAALDAALQAGCDEAALYNTDFDLTVDAGMKPGTYVGEAYGCWKKGSIEGERHGTPAIILPTQVQVTVDENRILDVQVLDCSDTPGFKDPAVDVQPGAVVEQQSVLVDNITGATMTSSAILSAIAKALEQAGANLVAFAKKTPHHPVDVAYDCDMLIIGAGLTGTMAAMRANDLGLKTVVMEKTARVSGCGACASGPFSVGSKLAKEVGTTLTAESEYFNLMEASSWRMDANLVYNIFMNSGRIADWVQENWESVGQKGFSKPRNATSTTHSFGKGTAKFKALWDGIMLPGGVELLSECSANELIMKDGVCVGAIGRKKDGSEVTVNAKAVLICTGGFGGSPAMMEKLLGTSNFGLVGLSSSTGDGISMALDAGACLSLDVSPHLAEFCNNDKLDFYAGYMKFTNQLGFLLLDPSGDRFMNEEYCITFSNQKGAAAMRRPSYCYIIYTQDDLDKMVRSGVWEHLSEEYIKAVELRDRIKVPAYYTLYEEMDEALKAGQAFKADTLEGLGEAVGFDMAIYNKAIDEYKQVIATGVDTRFGKGANLLYPLDNGPFYAVRVIPPIDGTFNGIRINKTMQALDDQMRPIRGLYIGGTDAGGFFTYPYNYGGGTSGFCIYSGCLAAEYAKEQMGL